VLVDPTNMRFGAAPTIGLCGHEPTTKAAFLLVSLAAWRWAMPPEATTIMRHPRRLIKKTTRSVGAPARQSKDIDKQGDITINLSQRTNNANIVRASLRNGAHRQKGRLGEVLTGSTFVCQRLDRPARPTTGLPAIGPRARVGWQTIRRSAAGSAPVPDRLRRRLTAALPASSATRRKTAFVREPEAGATFRPAGATLTRTEQIEQREISKGSSNSLETSVSGTVLRSLVSPGMVGWAGRCCPTDLRPSGGCWVTHPRVGRAMVGIAVMSSRARLISHAPARDGDFAGGIAASSWWISFRPVIFPAAFTPFPVRAGRATRRQCTEAAGGHNQRRHVVVPSGIAKFA
jgi:hypothetical protein